MSESNKNQSANSIGVGAALGVVSTLIIKIVFKNTTISLGLGLVIGVLIGAIVDWLYSRRPNK
jgi:uncharacterized membrane protein